MSDALEIPAELDEKIKDLAKQAQTEGYWRGVYISNLMVAHSAAVEGVTAEDLGNTAIDQCDMLLQQGFITQEEADIYSKTLPPLDLADFRREEDVDDD